MDVGRARHGREAGSPPWLRLLRTPTAAAHVEAVALVLAVVSPLLPYLVHALTMDLPRFALEGDYATLELATRFVPTGKTLLGPYSRFGFNHPGPLYFYVLAPLYALCGGESRGLYAGACAVNIVAAASVVVAARRAASRPHAVGTALVLLGWLAAFGNACTLPWNPLVVALPVVAFLTLATFFARGETSMVPAATFFGALAAQSHVATCPLVVGTAVFAVVLHVRSGHGRARSRRERIDLLLAGIVLALAVAPMVFEELTSREGNITKLARFFLHRSEPMKPFGTAFRNWMFATSSFGDRLLSGAMLDDGAEPPYMQSALLPGRSTITMTSLTVLLSSSACVAAGAALRRRDGASGALLATGALASLLAVVALRSVVGPDVVYLVFWTTATSVLLWIGIASSLFVTVVHRFRRIVPPRHMIGAAGAAVLSAAAVSTFLNLSWSNRVRLAPPVDPHRQTVYRSLRDRLGTTGETPVVHAHGAWVQAAAILLELTKDGIDACVVERERFILGRQACQAERAVRPIHLYVQQHEELATLVPCLRQLSTSGDLELYWADRDVERCDASVNSR